MLVVDDESVVRRLVASAVTELDPEKVFEADDGLQAQEILRREPVDIVITDVNQAGTGAAGMRTPGAHEHLIHRRPTRPIQPSTSAVPTIWNATVEAIEGQQ